MEYCTVRCLCGSEDHESGTSVTIDQIEGFTAPKTMTPEELGDTLARLVWETFSDFLADGEAVRIADEVGVSIEKGLPSEKMTEEILIFFLWSHTRALQLAFYGRASEDLLRQGLDALHRAVFDDLAEQGTPRAQLPILEQRMAARYAEYYRAAESSDDEVGKTALRYFARKDLPPASRGPLAALLTARAIQAAKPLTDFLGDVTLVA